MSKLIGVAILLIINLITNALLVFFGWNWFLIEVFPIEVISFKTAFILGMAKYLILFKYSKFKEYTSDEEKIKEISTVMLTPYFYILLAYIVKLIVL